MTTRRRLLISGSLLVAGSGLSLAAQSPVLVAVYESLFRQFAESGRTHFVLEWALDPREFLPPAEIESLNFPTYTKSHRRADLGSSLVRLLANSEYLEIFSDTRSCSEAWREFHRRFPEAKVLVQLSAVAISETGREAHVLLSVGSACLGSTIDLLRFTASGREWTFANSRNIARS